MSRGQGDECRFEGLPERLEAVGVSEGSALQRGVFRAGRFNWVKPSGRGGTGVDPWGATVGEGPSW